MEAINTLVRRQEEIGKQIQKILANTKKDPAPRKTEEYFSKRFTAVESFWEEIQLNHQEICSKTDSHKYFEINYYSQLKRLYEETKTYLADNQKEIQQGRNEDQEKKEEKEEGKKEEKKEDWKENKQAERSPMDIRMKKQDIRIQQLQETIMQIEDELQESKSKLRYETLLKKINKQWEAIHDLNEEIMVLEEDFVAPYFIENVFHRMERRYEEVVENLEATISNYLTTASKPNINLPTIKIPIFDGNYESWSTFHDIFLKVIHNNTFLTNAEKMQYLKTNIKGEPSRLIHHLNINEVNYDAAWELLRRRYHNKRLLLNKFLDKILDMPSIPNESASKLKQLHDTVVECLKAINNLGIDTETWGPMIAKIITRKWDSETNRIYEQALKEPHEIQDFGKLMDFLETRFQSLEAISDKNSHSTVKIRKPQNGNTSCKYCMQPHAIYTCPQFKALTTSERSQAIRAKNLCQNCLSHDKKERCLTEIRCRFCKKAHHSLLHFETPKRQNMDSSRNSSHVPSATRRNTSQQAIQSAMVTNREVKQENAILLATALVHASARDGTQQLLRVLIDTGSQASFITEEAAQNLGMQKQKIYAEINGIGSISPKVSNYKIEAQLKPRIPSDFFMNVELLLLPKLTQAMPQRPFMVDLENWKNYILADPTFNKPGPIDIILGAQECSQIMTEGIRKLSNGLLGQNTEFGWILSGSINDIPPKSLQVISMISRVSEDQQLAKFWEIEEVDAPSVMSPENQHCEDFYNKTTTRNDDGTYTVRIPFNEKIEDLGHSKSRAVSRLFQLEKRLGRNRSLKEQYTTFMEEYIKLGHMKIAPPPSQDEKTYYIPHQPVTREESTTTKLRVVFDASCKTSTNTSLNEAMHTGPRLQQELSDILLRWRKYKIALTADIEKMYRQIKLHEEDQKYHRILWRPDTSQPIEEYQLTTVTYGTTAAPYLAMRTLQQLAKDEENIYPKASEVTLKDFYVDDLLSGANSIEEAITLQSELINMMKSGGFTLRKWLSNRSELLENLPKALRESSHLDLSQDLTKKTLGIQWAPFEDVFRFKVETSDLKKTTKRNILSEIAKIFDPLGWLAPVVIKAKLIIQDLWLQNLHWDHAVPKETEKIWSEFHQQLKSMEDITLRRWIKICPDEYNIEIHGFCDASERAYGAVIYSKTTEIKTDKVTITLLIAKSKVAPAKTKTTLPRLELCAALLLARLMKKTIAALEIEKPSVFAWSDSMITLSWIKGNPTRWKTFVANRVCEIIQTLDAEHWYYVPTKDNPADVISRGIEPTRLKNFNIWWNGPDWLQDPHKRNWPQDKQPLEIVEEIKHCFQVHVNESHEDLSTRFSSLTKALRVLSYCRRFLDNCRKLPTKGTFLTPQELETTLTNLAKIIQATEFKHEINSLQSKKQVHGRSKLATLDPFLDDKQILRVGGRLQNSNLPFNEKHPIILPSNCHLTKLIIDNAHITTLHGGNQMTQAFIRRKFWIINGKQAVRSHIRRCVKCTRFKAQTTNQKMGDLPAPRVTPSPPFTHTGVDYAGPIQIRTTKGRGHKSYKGYIAIFVCLSTKAIHLEVVSDMSTEAFLAAYRRFISRRGNVSHMYSDNATTFVGASNVLDGEVKAVFQAATVQEKLASNGTQWHFIPPAAPHFGGIWEAGVKSMKYHLKRILGDTTLTYEETSTLLYQIEACLNSRPLCPLTNDTNDVQALTPGHFLIGRELVSPPDPIDIAVDHNMSLRWKLLQKMKKDFWRIWSSEYLSRLQQRYKWKENKANLQVGDLVIIKEEISPSKWPLARVSEVHPGKDGKVRVISLQKSGGNIVKRPITNIVPLPVDTKNEHNEVPSKAVVSNHVTTPSKFWWIFLLLFMLIAKPIEANYTLYYPKPGLYVEHIGHSKIGRGTFRIELQYDLLRFEEDVEAANRTILDMEKLCGRMKELTDDTPCENLLHHLQELEKQVIWLKDGIHNLVDRQRRGVLGQLMTAIFGVNDEVYRDIEALDKNQHELIRASNHQTKIMLSTLSAFNETEARINKKLQHFQQKLKAGLDAINGMSYWYSRVDKNALGIHVLSSYEMAENFIEEIIEHYGKLLNIQVRRGSFYELILPSNVHKIITTASAKLPSNIQILSQPLINTKLRRNQTCIHVYGYFPLVERFDFILMKITPVPIEIKNNSYWIMDIPNEVLAVDYNSQLYFTLPDEELRNSLVLGDNIYLCLPTVVKNIGNNPNCIIDEIYQRVEKTGCDMKKNKITSLIWKQLYARNTWMFISNKLTKAAITCNGIREDVFLNNTGILQVSQDCIIHTKQNILTSKREESIQVITAYAKHIPIQINVSIHQEIPKKIEPEEEPVLGISDPFANLKREEEKEQKRQQDIHWELVKHHTTVSNIITVGVILIILLLLWIVYKIRQCKQRPRKASSGPKEKEPQPVEEFELQSIYSD